ncbi:hypothetical protein ABZV65_30725 [Streptomyces bauhiniae]|uniref:hypothetical protein n=1 Tax=Streptomyces bauhiniae TaxID=2340725 RepID=UPI0033B43162
MTVTAWEGYALLFEGHGHRMVRVQELLAVAGHRKAGARILESIEEALAHQEIRHFPTRLPRDQTALILLYRQDQQGVGALLDLVRQLTESGHATGPEITFLHMLVHHAQRGFGEGAAPA